MTEKQNAEMLELANEIEQRHGDDHNGNRSYLFTREQRDLIVTALYAAPSPHPRGEPVDITGWKLVPDQTTETMWQAGRSADVHPGDSYSKVWRAMFEAAPNVDDCETTAAPPPAGADAVREARQALSDFKRLCRTDISRDAGDALKRLAAALALLPAPQSQEKDK